MSSNRSLCALYKLVSWYYLSNATRLHGLLALCYNCYISNLCFFDRCCNKPETQNSKRHSSDGWWCQLQGGTKYWCQKTEVLEPQWGSCHVETGFFTSHQWKCLASMFTNIQEKQAMLFQWMGWKWEPQMGQHWSWRQMFSKRRHPLHHQCQSKPLQP